MLNATELKNEAIIALLEGNTADALQKMKLALDKSKVYSRVSKKYVYDELIKLYILLIEEINGAGLYDFRERLNSWILDSVSLYHDKYSNTIQSLLNEQNIGSMLYNPETKQSNKWSPYIRASWNNGLFNKLGEVWLKSLKYDKLVQEIEDLTDDAENIKRIKALAK